MNLKTGAKVGYLGVGTSQNVSIVADKSQAARVEWRRDVEPGQLYLGKDTTPDDRFLGLGNNGYADWGLWQAGGGSQKRYIDYLNYDKGTGIIALGDNPSRKLYAYGDWACWSEGDNDQILSCRMEDF